MGMGMEIWRGGVVFFFFFFFFISSFVSSDKQ